MSRIFKLNKDKSFVIVFYSYHNNNIIYNAWPLDHNNFAYLFQIAYYEYIKDKEFHVSVIETDALNYLENAEAAFDDPTYYADQIQKAIEECNIKEWLKDFKKEKYGTI